MYNEFMKICVHCTVYTRVETCVNVHKQFKYFKVLFFRQRYHSFKFNISHKTCAPH